MEDEKGSKAKPPPSLPANYVNIVQLQERWKKEKLRKEMEKEAEDRRLLEEKERSEMQIRLQEKVEPDSRPRYRRYRNAGARRDNFEVGEGGKGKSKGFGQKEMVGRGGMRATVEGCARREGVPARVSSKSEDVVVENRVLGLHGESENLSMGREIGSRTVCRMRNKSSRMNVSVQFVPKTENLSVNEDCADQGNRTVQYVPKQETPSNQQGSQAAKPRSSGNKMDSSVDIDGELEKVPTGGTRGGSNSNSGGGKIMVGNEDVDEELKKDRKSGSRGGSYSKGTNRIGWNVKIDGKTEKIPIIITGRRIKCNSSGGSKMNGDIDEKLERGLISDTRGRSNNNSGGSDGIDKNVDVDGKLEKVPTSGARRRSIHTRSGGNRMKGDIDEKLEKDPMSDTRGGSNNNSGGSNGIDKNVDIDGKLEKVPMSGARVRSICRISGDNRMNGDADEELERVPMSGARGGSNNYRKGSNRIDRDVIDGKSEKVLMSGARGGSNNYTKGSNRNVDTDGKLEIFSMTGAGGGSNTSNEGDRANQRVYVQGKLERVRISGARRGNSFRWAEKRGFERDRSRNSMLGMVWVKKGEVSHDNAAGIQSSGDSSKGSE